MFFRVELSPLLWSELNCEHNTAHRLKSSCIPNNMRSMCYYVVGFLFGGVSRTLFEFTICLLCPAGIFYKFFLLTLDLLKVDKRRKKNSRRMITPHKFWSCKFWKQNQDLDESSVQCVSISWSLNTIRFSACILYASFPFCCFLRLLIIIIIIILMSKPRFFLCEAERIILFTRHRI